MALFHGCAADLLWTLFWVLSADRCPMKLAYGWGLARGVLGARLLVSFWLA